MRAAESEQRKAIASARSSAGVKLGRSLVGVLLADAGGLDRVDDDDVGGGPGALEGVGEGQGPGLGGGLGRGVGGVGVLGVLGGGGGDEDEAAVVARGQGGVEGAGGRAGGCGPGGRGGTRSRRGRSCGSGRRRGSRRPGGGGRRRGRSAPRSRRPSRWRRPRRGGRRRGGRRGRRGGRGPRRPQSAISWLRSARERLAPASARRLATTGPSPPPAPAIAITLPSRSVMAEDAIRTAQLSPLDVHAMPRPIPLTQAPRRAHRLPGSARWPEAWPRRGRAFNRQDRSC